MGFRKRHEKNIIGYILECILALSCVIIITVLVCLFPLHANKLQDLLGSQPAAVIILNGTAYGLAFSVIYFIVGSIKDHFLGRGNLRGFIRSLRIALMLLGVIVALPGLLIGLALIAGG